MQRTKWFILIALLVATVAVLNWRASGDEANDLKGKAAPDFSLKTVDGKDVKLSDQKGNVVLVDFWATWCPPCKESLPHVQKVSADEALAKKGLKVFAVNDKEDPDVVKAFLAANKYTFMVPMDVDQKAMIAYSVSGIPTTLIVGRDGKITDVFVGYDEESAKQIDAAIDKALEAK
jgi:cytochrome c biogenesis protein CcmG, thiol:disulfide interchange protein DsbE